jgi:hypothetical protein
MGAGHVITVRLEIRKGREHSEDLGVDGKIILRNMDLREIRFGDVDWIHLAQDRDRWWTLVNIVMNLRVP